MNINPFRVWYYVRQGFQTYLALVISVSNLIITTYYLAIKNVPSLAFVFPNVGVFSGIIISIGIPLAASLGYFHYKKSHAQKSQIEIELESNPLTSMTILMYLMLQKIINKEPMSNDDLSRMEVINKTAERMLHKQHKVDGTHKN